MVELYMTAANAYCRVIDLVDVYAERRSSPKTESATQTEATAPGINPPAPRVRRFLISAPR